MPDTSVYINYPEKLEEWDLSAELQTLGIDVHLLVPIIVIDELVPRQATFARIEIARSASSAA
jgi:hypothetical protein